jgi:hypothetical protein
MGVLTEFIGEALTFAGVVVLVVTFAAISVVSLIK